MVQFIDTPWPDSQDLLLVRQQLYPDHPSLQPTSLRAAAAESSRYADKGPEAETFAPTLVSVPAKDGRELAVGRVMMWSIRGRCPQLMESTAGLVSAVLLEEEMGNRGKGSADYAVRMSYAMAISQFVTGLLDGHQDKAYKQTMWAIAANVGLPATFVELRHQIAHEALPELSRLRSTAHAALDWIWIHYWRDLISLPKPELTPEVCRSAILNWLKEKDERRKGLLRQKIKRRFKGDILVKGLKSAADWLIDQEMSNELGLVVELEMELLHRGGARMEHEEDEMGESKGKDEEEDMNSIETDLAVLREDILKVRRLLEDDEATRMKARARAEADAKSKESTPLRPGIGRRREGSPGWKKVAEESYKPQPIGKRYVSSFP